MLFDSDRFTEIWVTISRNKVRSLLTGFGVFWGIFLLIVMMGAGTGMQRGMLKNLEGFATNTCIVGAEPTSEPYKGFQKGRRWTIHNRDFEILKQSIPELDVLSPMVFADRGAGDNVIHGEHSGSYNVRGLHPNYQLIESPFITKGRFINDMDISLKRKVCVIGKDVYNEIFPTKTDPVGEYLRVSGVYYQIVGVASGMSNVSIGGRTSSSVLIPFTTLQQVNNSGDEIDILSATAKPNCSAKTVEEKMKTILKANNSISPTDNQAVFGFNLEEVFNMFKYLFLGIAILIWIVGSGTLIAGIVGVSNIMMVTVKERTKEIGVRRALGAKPITIVMQIMSESLLLTAIFGLLGLTLGILTLYLADVYWIQKAENLFLTDPMVSFGTAVSSTIILLFCGLIAGYIPTLRALQIKAIDAIREE